jgi:predicted Zn-dependent protease
MGKDMIDPAPAPDPKLSLERAIVQGHASVSRALARPQESWHTDDCQKNMPNPEEQYDDAMFDFSQGDYDSAAAKFQKLLGDNPENFDAQLALGMAFYRKGDYAAAIVEGHKAEKLRPKEQLVHTNLSLFYMKAGDKQAAEHHGLQARIAGWRGNMAAPDAEQQPPESELQMAKPKPPPIPQREMPWKKNKPVNPKPDEGAPPTE